MEEPGRDDAAYLYMLTVKSACAMWPYPMTEQTTLVLGRYAKGNLLRVLKDLRRRAVAGEPLGRDDIQRALFLAARETVREALGEVSNQN